MYIFEGSASTSLVAYCRFNSMWSVCPCIGTDTAPLQERIKQPVQADIYPNWLAAINVRLCLLPLNIYCGSHL